jgi:hypothetical protein
MEGNEKYKAKDKDNNLIIAQADLGRTIVIIQKTRIRTTNIKLHT